jgi:hypothetical protein
MCRVKITDIEYRVYKGVVKKLGANVHKNGLGRTGLRVGQDTVKYGVVVFFHHRAER